MSKNYKEMNKREKALNTAECLGIHDLNELDRWFGLTKGEIKKIIAEYNKGLTEPMHYIDERARLFYDLINGDL